MLTIRSAILCFLTISATSAIQANESIVYGGIGSARSNSSSATSDNNPFSLGYINISDVRSSVWGLDFSKEGSLLDSTYRQNRAVKQGTSYNLLLGTNLAKTESSRFDVAILIGAREKTKDCPSSYLGYQCYANAEPDTQYGFNYGAVLTWSFKGMMIGIRATGESTQAIVGLKF